MRPSEDKVALITGSSSGIGAVAAIEYSKQGYALVITGRNEQRLNEVADKCKGASPKKLLPLTVQCDFVDLRQVDMVFERTVNKYRRIDLLINNAGHMGQSKRIEEQGFMADFSDIMAVNLTAAVRLSQLTLPYLTKTKGCIINVTSILGRLPYPTLSYSVSKAGLSMVTKVLANIVGSSGVRVVSVSPGPIKTDIQEDMGRYAETTLMHRVGQPKEVVDLMMYLSSSKAAFIHGCEFDIDGGAMARFLAIRDFYPDTNG